MYHWKIKDNEIEQFSLEVYQHYKVKISYRISGTKNRKIHKNIHFTKFYLFVIKNIEVKIELPVDEIKIEILLV